MSRKKPPLQDAEFVASLPPASRKWIDSLSVSDRAIAIDTIIAGAQIIIRDTLYAFAEEESNPGDKAAIMAIAEVFREKINFS